MRLTAKINVYAGAFASQPLAFAHLLDAAQKSGLSPDFDHVEVLAPPSASRLQGYFSPSVVDALLRDAATDALILVLPGALITGAFQPDHRLRHIGCFEGEVVRA